MPTFGTKIYSRLMAHDNSILDLDKVFRLLFELNDLGDPVAEEQRAV